MWDESRDGWEEGRRKKSDQRGKDMCEKATEGQVNEEEYREEGMGGKNMREEEEEEKMREEGWFVRGGGNRSRKRGGAQKRGEEIGEEG